MGLLCEIEELGPDFCWVLSFICREANFYAPLSAKLPLQVTDPRLCVMPLRTILPFFFKLSNLERYRWAPLTVKKRNSLKSVGVKILLQNTGSMPLIFLSRIYLFHFSSHQAEFWVFATCNQVLEISCHFQIYINIWLVISYRWIKLLSLELFSYFSYQLLTPWY